MVFQRHILSAWVLIEYRLAGGYLRFISTYCPHIQSLALLQSTIIQPRRLETECASEKSVCAITLHDHRREQCTIMAMQAM